jgi:hypothetical protein
MTHHQSSSPPRGSEPEPSTAGTSQRPGPHGPRAHPLSERCKAKAKSTGERCKCTVIGGGVCPTHGGNAPQVRAAREARVLAGEAALAASGDEDMRRDPRAALLAAAQDADLILQRIKRRLAEGGTLDGPLLQALGDWIDRTTRTSKVVIDARIDEQMAELEAAKAKMVGTAVNEALEAIRATPEQRETFVRVLLSRLRVADAEHEARRPRLSLLPGSGS